MTIDHFYYYYYWKVESLLGTVQETFKKVKAFYETPLIYQSQPVPGSREGIQTLKDMGYRLIIVTARGPDTQDESWEWVNKTFPDCFESIICTGQFKDAHKEGHEVVTKLSKAEVCFDLGARLLIDDSSENAIQCATAHPNATRVLLFGNYEWNQRISSQQDYNDSMSYDIRLLAEHGREFWKAESLQIPDGVPLERVRDWAEVVRWIRKPGLKTECR
ncbi:hypothetical protein BDZ89DRAFT_1018191 [Hymenopellis radicata]|nr:hypothetical protein BDZ89DRAFT_1018191 [Hymenopellis radicata]